MAHRTLGIEATGLTKSYGDHQVLAGIDLTVPVGTVLALLGPNGAGKTTTVRILATLAEADGGRARVAGRDVVADRSEVRRRISLTGQHAALDELQTGAENLRMVGRLLGLRGRAARARADELLDRMGLRAAGDRRVGTYSGGMRRRLDIAAGLVVEPEVVFLDEPTTGLDPRSRLDLWEVVTRLTDGGVTVLLTTQYLEEADRLADRIAVVDHGRIVAEGTAAELKARVGGHRLELVAPDERALDALAAAAGPAAVVDRGARLVAVPVDGSAGEARRLLDELDPRRDLVAAFTVQSASLDDVFLTLTGRPAATPEVPARA